ncbi:class IV adenylate cyclase [Salinigranum salinum]|uniref:class IV adenylate cyclase n=1 Tax=Salinigranum salinum TaxID=1364937 RepID=UPI001260CC38|nr:class IV adenylate cyclase [Salinigranum salinum]
MYEVEVKLAADHDAIRARLSEIGAESLETVTQHDTYYDAPHREFAETDEALRIRRVAHTDAAEHDDTGAVEDGHASPETLVTYKGPLVDADSKTRREHETGVDDDETMDAILRAVGFEPAAVVEKRRERFRLDEYTVTLDAVTDLGEYVEVETESTDIDGAREGAFELVRDLGLDPTDQIRTSYLGLLLGRAADE